MNDDPLRQEIETLKAQIAELQKTIGNLGDAARDAGEQKFEDTKDRIDKQARETLEQIQQRVERTLDRGSKAFHDLDEQVTRHPVGSLLTAFGLGVLIATLLGAGRKH